jgi:thioesterase DpgC
MNNTTIDFAPLDHAKLPDQLVSTWLAAVPTATVSGDWERDSKTFGAFWATTNRTLAALPAKSSRSADQQEAAQLLLYQARNSRENFLSRHVTAVYNALTDNRNKFMRVDELAAAAALKFPGLVPSAETVTKENTFLQKDKDGHEIDQGILFAHILADEACGTHLCHAMLLPGPKSLDALAEFRKKGYVDLGNGFVEREGRAAIFNLRNPKFLNAEDDSTVDVQEIGADVCTLDPDSEIAVLRGARLDSGKYGGRRVYCTGINLTKLYHGQISYLWYLKRDLGWINKVFRGIASPDQVPDDVHGFNTEKLWISAIDAFAIGGGCQYTLVTDYNIAGQDAYMTLPARKEGIIPGAANLRMHRFVGDRITRQAVMMDLRIDCDSPNGRMLCDRIVDAEQVDQAVAETVDGIARSGVVSATGNRRAFRVAHEPLETFRRYMAVYAREQAYCHFSPALIRNLEQSWNAHQRRV